MNAHRITALSDPINNAQLSTNGGSPPSALSAALHYPDAKFRNRKIGEVLVELGFTGAANIDAALNSAARTGLLTGQALIQSGVVTGRQLALGLAASCGLPFIDYDEFPVDDAVLARVNTDVARQHMAIPCARLEDGTVVVAISDYKMVSQVESLSHREGAGAIFVVAQENDVYFMIKRAEELRAATG